MIGKKLGHYEIQTLLGAGGMGEVYRASDTRLDRTVAVKVLPAHASSPELRERFEREARTISSLNHPHICTLFDVGSQDGTDFLVMEYLEGETLGDRLKKGPLPIAQALTFAIEIAGALDKAHRLGIIHRDLKPANIMITASGTKLLDFGLAKLTPTIRGITQAQSQMPTNVPTNAALTAQGAILGTLQYMPPEQIEGEEADARADIFSFGAVLYEMVTGRTAFEGKSRVTLISSIVSSEPPLPSELRTDSPPLLDHILRRCLAKAPDDRWQTASDLMRELKWVADEAPASVSLSTPVAPAPSKSQTKFWIAASALFVLAVIALLLPNRSQPAAAGVPIRLSFAPPPDSEFPGTSGGSPWPELSPDGRRIVFGAGTKDGRQILFVRSLDGDSAQPLTGTDDGEQPFWSPDGRFIAFFARNKLKKIDAGGGTAQTICDIAGAPREGSWGADDTLIFSVNAGAVGPGIWRVSASGGQPVQFTTVNKERNETGYLYPHFLPDGRHFLFAALGARASIAIGSLDSKEIKYLIDAKSKAEYAAPGYVLYVRESGLVAHPFDAKRLELTGSAIPLVANIRHTNSSGIAAFSVANNGMIAFRTGEASEYSQPMWLDRSGREIERIGEPGEFSNVELSRDGKLAIMEKASEGNSDDLWILELARNIFNRFTTETGPKGKALWSPDNSRILYFRYVNTSFIEKPISRIGEEEVLLQGDVTTFPGDLSPDGKTLIYEKGEVTNLWVYTREDRKSHILLESHFTEIEPRFSPDGRWITYTSNESGPYEVYARSFPSNENKIQISTNGGTKARWSHDGKEIFYLAPDHKLMSVPVAEAGNKLEVKSPVALFPIDTAFGIGVLRNMRQQYDVSPNGKRFLVLAKGQSQPPPITIFSNWQSTLKR